ncbi:FtsL-like putative cell division protein [Ornithobacterium rhinotracheale]|uniref:S-adenosyl-methyltransferase n=1 Tax=Ornithobacterium rhinotracheale (strain ATCC 51463 / DSM 15997 / CCUG 23171 / CIP 104009 / LMG 9086) TaxID=867902 RepID=I3ZYJ5_ORNRL|nr:FtsL-like putative cell division protein [Ornithobacterium rhinotracheale]AFL96779.1 hypothetical protein Ornrh_0578 [Ornithobacterium rhinotracheale DSM 15997]AIP99451.1 S-adenosyl-methyltransferase MraW [Ornithobacterium rhinotracheale ORT-UMN 88]KGB66681.1 hypothetical protein Q787_06665 [Ornithobacterium rhinotracheale H06-030791]MBN3662455.1 S-adenosyl-methyltransferase [Ornithobacterium rhinotracheale]MCK0194127.1 S-adenosyl-methyltransferase [Ornithobacterium rhinotracheale]
MAKKKKKVQDYVKGKFLVDEGSINNWKFMGFLALLAMISIISSQYADKQVVKIKKLETKVSNLKSEYAFVHKQLMQHQMRSHVADMVAKDSIKNSTVQPYRMIEK